MWSQNCRIRKKNPQNRNSTNNDDKYANIRIWILGGSIKEEKEEITTTQLDEIQKEIKENKERSLIKNIDRYKLILTNILIAITSIIYLWLVVGLGNSLNTITFLSNMKTLIIIEIIAVVIMFEISNKKESKSLLLYAVEAFIMTSFTMILYGLYGRENQNIRFFVLGMVAIIFIYYVVKSLIIKFKKI